MDVKIKGKKTYTSFDYEGETYPARLLGDDLDNIWIVAGVELWDAISDPETSDCKDDEAQEIDNKVFYYLNYGNIDNEDETIIDEIGDGEEFNLRPLTNQERKHYEMYGIF